MLVTRGKELFEMRDWIGSRKTYKQLFEQKAPISYQIVAGIGVLSSYLRINVCDAITVVYTKIRRLKLSRNRSYQRDKLPRMHRK
jgi:hypothetical protein